METFVITISLTTLLILAYASAEVKLGEPVVVDGEDESVRAVAKAMLDRALEQNLLVGQDQVNDAHNNIVGPTNIEGTKQLVNGNLYDLTFSSSFKGWTGGSSRCRAVVLEPFNGPLSFQEEPKCHVEQIV